MGWDAKAGTILDRVRARGIVACGGFERPGLAQIIPSIKAWQGIEVDLCRAIAVAVVGSADKISFRGYAAPVGERRVSEGPDAVSFLTGSEIHAGDLSGRIIPGPTIFVESHAVMVPVDSKEQHVADLPDDGSICFPSGTPIERSLPTYFESIGKSWQPFPFSEDGEMIDAYNVRRCHALVHELTQLAALRQDRGINNLESRVLPEPLTSYPVLAATSTADGEWSAIVAWTIATLMVADRPSGNWIVGGVNAMPAPLADLGLDKGWQARVVAVVGTYRDIFDRNVGAKSPLNLPPGLGAPQTAGGLLLSPVLE
jgi:general L-amino acid transport system substrate-binding protein